MDIDEYKYKIRKLIEKYYIYKNKKLPHYQKINNFNILDNKNIKIIEYSDNTYLYYKIKYKDCYYDIISYFNETYIFSDILLENKNILQVLK